MVRKLLTPSNWKKTYYYLKKNGFKAAFMAALERLEKSENDTYVYEALTAEALKQQAEQSRQAGLLFSVLVPVYCTPEKYFREMLDSVINQSYHNWELLLGDASPDDRLERIVKEYGDARIRYIRLSQNKGISENTNAILYVAEGDYIGLLDHDDVLTKDALFSVWEMIEAGRRTGKSFKMLYSDEDKGDGEMQHFYDLNKKPVFDQDYLWSNNYICHFTVMEAALMKTLGFRSEFDGAQDFDLFLRAARRIEQERRNSRENLQIGNISRVLYHWRCHIGSTAVNPQSKLYAYEAGRRAVEEDLKERGIEAKVSHSRHLGFYKVHFADIYRDRPEVAMVAGPVYKRGRICAGARDVSGNLLYGGLLKGFSGGHLHRASVRQRCYMADFANAGFREALLQEFLDSEGSEWNGTCSGLSREQMDRLQRAWADYVQSRDMLILYDPDKEQDNGYDHHTKF